MWRIVPDSIRLVAFDLDMLLPKNNTRRSGAPACFELSFIDTASNYSKSRSSSIGAIVRAHRKA